MNHQALTDTLSAAVSPFHAVSHIEDDLRAAGFLPLAMKDAWHLQPEGRYFINHHGSTLVSFVLPGDLSALPALRIAAAHTDFPCLRIKANPDVAQNGYLKINTEVYGGAILNTWLDRPLGIAGRIVCKSDDVLSPAVFLYDSRRPILIIPNLAIHQNREVNKGMELNKQTDLLPLFGLGEEDHAFVKFLSNEIGVSDDDILDFDLTVYNCDAPTLLGRNEELLSSPRIDNSCSCAAITEALLSAKGTSLQMAAYFDHEEVGSRTKQGAGSLLLSDVIQKVYVSLGFSSSDAKSAIYEGLMLSVDVAHATHPNHPEKEDITNLPVMGGGFAIKAAAAQSYATDAEAIAIIEQMALSHNISYQKFVNRSDIAGGGTLGAIASAFLPMRIVDIGIPILAMHSARETMGIADYTSLLAILDAFYGS